MTFSAIKDTQAVIDYTIDWSATLSSSSPSDTISTSSWAVDNGVTVDSDSNTTTTTTAWVSGGTQWKIASLVNTVTTVGGRTYERTIHLTLQDK
jgi:hypothetical protein